MPRRGRDIDDGSENQEVVGTFETLRDEGEHFLHVKQYQKAVESFTKALEFNPDDKGCLVTRSKCWLQLGYSEYALEDAEAALKDDKDFIRGLYQKAEAKYQLGDFETALVYFHRGNKLRSELQDFRLGIQKCQEAIENSIGHPDSVKLSAEGDLTYFYKQEEAKAKARGTYGKPTAKTEKKKERERPKSMADTKTIKQLLGELYGDKEFLEYLLNSESVTGKTSHVGEDIRNKVCDGLHYLNTRADFWRQQKPMYARKRDRDRQRKSAKARQQDPTNYLLKCLEDIDNDQVSENYERSLSKAKRTLQNVEKMNYEQLQNKAEIEANLHSQIGNAYLELGKYNFALDHHQKDEELADQHDLEDAKSRALDNLGRVHARKGNFEKAIEVWQKKLPLSKSPLESTWLYHEVGRCYLELEKFQDSREFGAKSKEAAKEADDLGWQLHATVLMAQSEVKQGELQDAAESFEQALEIAKQLKDNSAVSAIQKAQEEVNARIVRGVKDNEDGDEDDRGQSKSPEEGRKSQVSGKGDNYEDDFEEEDKDINSHSESEGRNEFNDNQNRERKISICSDKDASKNKDDLHGSEELNDTNDNTKEQSEEQCMKNNDDSIAQFELSPTKNSGDVSQNENDRNSSSSSPKSLRQKKLSNSSYPTAEGQTSNQDDTTDANRKTSKGENAFEDGNIGSHGKTKKTKTDNAQEGNTVERNIDDRKDQNKQSEANTGGNFADDKGNGQQRKESKENKKDDVRDSESYNDGDDEDEDEEIQRVSEANNVAVGNNTRGDDEVHDTNQQKASSEAGGKKKMKHISKTKSKDSVKSPYETTRKRSSDTSVKHKNRSNVSRSEYKKHSLSKQDSTQTRRKPSERSISSSTSTEDPRKQEKIQNLNNSQENVQDEESAIVAAQSESIKGKTRNSIDNSNQETNQGKYGGQESYTENLESKEKQETGNAVDFKLPTGGPSPSRSPRASPAKRSVSIKEPSPTGRQSREEPSRTSKQASVGGSPASGKDASPAPNTTPVQTQNADEDTRAPSNEGQRTSESGKTDIDNTDLDQTEHESETQVEVETEETIETDQGRKSATPEVKQSEQREEPKDKEEEQGVKS